MQPQINPHERIVRLVNAATERIGGQNEMARSISYLPSDVSNWKSGERPCPLEAQVLMAHAAGLDPNEVLAYAMIERHANTPRGEKLLSALGKASVFMSALVVAVAAYLPTSASAGSVSSLLHLLNTMCRKVKSNWHFRIA